MNGVRVAKLAYCRLMDVFCKVLLRTGLDNALRGFPRHFSASYIGERSFRVHVGERKIGDPVPLLFFPAWIINPESCCGQIILM